MRDLARLLTAIMLMSLSLQVGVSRAHSQPGVSIIAWHDLPKGDRRSAELSGISWDQATSTLYAISDDAPRIVRLKLSDDYRAFSFDESISVSVPDSWDGEGIARSSRGFFISNENGPHIYELDFAGQLISWVPVPGHFNRVRANQSLESLTSADGGRFVFTANEEALTGDGLRSTTAAGTLVRIVRYDQVTTDTLEWAYRTEPVFSAGADGDNGVVDLAAISPTELLVLERSFVGRVGNSVRIYRVSLDEPTDIFNVETLSTETTTLSKTLVLDLAMLSDDGFPPSLQPQPNRILDNFEGLALGPTLPDGRRVIFMISDDNNRSTQIPRLLVLAVAGL